jgi:alpha-dioxygenase
MIPISRWADLTDDKEAIKALQEVYGNDVENLDLLVGLMAEKKITGYAISETAFFIFLLMASRWVVFLYYIQSTNKIRKMLDVRICAVSYGGLVVYCYCSRLEADRFFTSDFNKEVYTEKGLEWVNKNTESLKDVLNRHYPELVEKWMNSSSAFSVWSAMH